MMAFSKVSLFLSVLACAFLLSSYRVHCNANEDNLLNGINSYRQSLNRSALTKNDKAACLADRIADFLRYQSCTGADDFTAAGDPSIMVAELVNFPKLLRKCDIGVNTTDDGVIMPACIPKMSRNIVLSNYTHSQYAKFVNDSAFSGAGVGSKDNWIVVVLTTNKPAGSFSAAPGSPVAQGLAVLAFGLVFVTQCLLL